MSSPRKKPQAGPRTSEKPQPTPMRHGGQPANGKHVPSNVPGHNGPYDCSADVGSNVTRKPGADMDSGDVLAAPPWSAAYPTSGLTQDPMC